MDPEHSVYVLRLADTALVLGHRLSEWSGRGPTLEEDIALSNIALDQVGTARTLYSHHAALSGEGRSEDDLAYLRDAPDFLNLLLVEQPNGDFARTVVRQFLYSSFSVPLFEALTVSRDNVVAGVAAKATKEALYHLRHSAEWVIRLGDGTEESHRRAQEAVNELWMFTGEMFEVDNVDAAAIEAGVGVDGSSLRVAWCERTQEVFEQATLKLPADGWMMKGGKRGQHSEHLGHLLSEMQFLQRAYPGAKW